MQALGLVALTISLVPCDDTFAQDASPHEGDLASRDVLTGNWGGARSMLEDKGIVLGADTIDEFLGNGTGGTKTGTIYEGRLELFATLDLNKLFGWSDAAFHINAYQTHGRGLSSNDFGGNLMTASNIEAARSTRLFDLWIEQLFFDGALSIRGGQIAADDEFFTSIYAGNFINGTFGWPAIMASDLPNGGQAYPLATPGVRVGYAPNKETTFAVALMNGDPAGGGLANAQQRDNDGTAFRFNDGAFAIAEARYAINQAKDASGQPATYKLGLWYHSGAFDDERYDSFGQSLAAPTSTGIARKHWNNVGVYAVADQQLWRDSDADRNFGIFLRIGATPMADRNLVTFYADTGFNFKGIIPSRGDDVFGIALAVAQIGPTARARDQDQRQVSGIAQPIRDNESMIEITYRVQATPWWTLQPDLQFIRHPGGDVALSTPPTKAVPNTLVLGLRSAVLF
ncbi:MAG TPA: carbohydrate porin [Stellaceae bacterium]|nr:carbohydrate porin [Stellaceae bacterium]